MMLETMETLKIRFYLGFFVVSFAKIHRLSRKLLSWLLVFIERFREIFYDRKLVLNDADSVILCLQIEGGLAMG